jgi:hypothetical protein
MHVCVDNTGTDPCIRRTDDAQVSGHRNVVRRPKTRHQSIGIDD